MSTAYVRRMPIDVLEVDGESLVLLDPVGVTARTVRCTRLAELVNTLDTKLVAAAFGMDPQSVIAYLSDHVDEGRLPSPTPNT